MMATTHLVREPAVPGSGSGVRLGRRSWPIALLAALVAGAVGFGAGWLAFGGDNDTDEAATTLTGDFPTGRYEKRFNENHVFEFNDDGTYRYCEGFSCVAGAYAIHDDLYTEMTHDWAGARKVPATYQWSFDGAELSFDVVGEDVISSRLGTMSADYVPAD